MGTYNTKSPKQTTPRAPIARRAITNPILMAAAAVTVAALWTQNAVQAQYGSVLPQFSNTVVEPMHANSRSVRMRLSQKKSSGATADLKPFRRSRALRLAESPQGYASPVRFRRQDGDVFGEDQAGGGDPFGEGAIESPIKESPFAPYNSPTLPNRKTPVKNPFSEPEIEAPIVDPTPRTPSMDTKPVSPRLPEDGQFTPDPDSIPNLPKPDGGTRETERARTQRSTPDPEEVELEFDEDSIMVEEDTQPRRTPRTTGRRDSRDNYDDPRRPFRSNVYRPAPEPSYYAKPLAEDPRAKAAAGPYAPGANPHGGNPYAANPYLMNPYAVNPYAVNPYPASHSSAYPAPFPNPYAMNPYMGMGCPPACMGCQSMGCQSCQSCVSTNCCPTTDCNAGCATPTPAPPSDGVYENVVDQPTCAGTCGLGLNLCRRGSNSVLMPTGVPLYYVSLFGGWSDLSDLEIINEEGAINLDARNGVGLGAALGQIQGRNLRSELELSYRSHDIEDLLLRDFAGGREAIEGVGDIESIAGMLNVYWEFVDLLGGRLSPYIGAGVGAVNVTADMRLNGGTDAFEDGEDSSFAYQYMVGLNYKMREYSDLFIEYRHFAADSLRLDASLPQDALLNGDGELNYQSNNIFFGMRLKF